MSSRFLRSRLGFGIWAAGLGLCASTAWAQSDAALEQQILSGASRANSDAAQSGAENKTLLAEPQPPLPQAAPAPEPTSEQKEAQSEVDEAVRGPREIPREHILVVQYRYIRKEGAHEFTPMMLGVQPADSFRRQLGWGASYAYHFTENWGWEALQGMVFKNYETGLADTIHKKTTLFTDRKEPVFSLGSSILWTPLKSKASTATDIHYFEGFFLAGGGMTKYEDVTAGMANVGVGFRAYLSQRSLFKVEIRDYIDFVAGATEHRLNIMLGAALLLGGEK